MRTAHAMPLRPCMVLERHRWCLAATPHTPCKPSLRAVDGGELALDLGKKKKKKKKDLVLEEVGMSSGGHAAATPGTHAAASLRLC